MWSLILTAFNTISPINILSEYSYSQAQTINDIDQLNNPFYFNKLAQITNKVQVVSSLGYSLKYPPDTWQLFNTQNSNPNSDIFLSKIFPNSTNIPVVTITTTIRDFLLVPKKLPPNIKRFDKVAELYVGLMYRSGYKIYDVKPIIINQRSAFRVATEMPDKKGAITVLVEGKDEKMVVSTAIYPIDESIMNRATLEQVIAEIAEIQNSITIR